MKYVINKQYSFGTYGPGGSGTAELRVRMGHVKAYAYGEYFLNHQLDDLEIPAGNEFKDMLDESEAKSFAKSLYFNRERKRDRLCDFYDQAWELLATEYYYYTWSEEFIKDCIDYYNDYNQRKRK